MIFRIGMRKIRVLGISTYTIVSILLRIVR